MNCVSGKEWLVIILLGPPTRTIWIRGSYLWREFNIIWKNTRTLLFWYRFSRGFYLEIEQLLLSEVNAKKVEPLSSPHLASSVELVGKFDFTERYGSFHPVRPEVRRVRVDVHAAGCLRFGFATRDPLPVHIFPPVVVRRYKVQQNGVHCVRVQTRHVHFQHRKHAPWI